MFDILMYLFENVIHSEVELMVDQEELTEELTRAGFHRADILKALTWLEKLAELQESDTKPYLINAGLGSIRLYTQKEMDKIDTECRGFLLFLEQAAVITPEVREMVIDRLMALEGRTLELEDLKWVVLMVLFNVPNSESAYAHMEDLLFEAPATGVLQ
ncbi:DUF494 family protein [Paraferrimonas sedimenticola]|uniref:Protein Smg homolog n=1 Tax=Paraferrimonas sedimenticola TaxID=375674 RepID=A0AA37RYN3_9GAMM|nr:DUF494 family protein [Paraferrimonas sedimenticola]GLP97699.1 protein Smg [Paraferrimonas sedimenticola]